jgi:hypothetical protein
VKKHVWTALSEWVSNLYAVARPSWQRGHAAQCVVSAALIVQSNYLEISRTVMNIPAISFMFPTCSSIYIDILTFQGAPPVGQRRGVPVFIRVII